MWEIEDGMLVQTIECADFREAIDLINKIALLAEEAGHHPDLFLHDYQNVTVTLMTHDKNEVTEKDHQLAEKIDALLE